MTMLKTQTTAIAKRTLLPTIPSTYHEEPIEFSNEDIAKIIEQLVTKGPKYCHLKKSFTSDEATAFSLRLQKSSFVKIMVRKTTIKMGQERRLGNGLRGFSKLLLEQIQNQCWPLILIEKSLMDLDKKQQMQLGTLNELLQNNTYMKQKQA